MRGKDLALLLGSIVLSLAILEGGGSELLRSFPFTVRRATAFPMNCSGTG
jgi:hypothetical protein